MAELPQISDAEWQVMKVFWSNNCCTANQVVEILTKTTDWKPKTIKTLINRLINKKALGYEIDKQDKKTYHYFALIAEKDCIRVESQSFLNRVFGGSMNIMLASFIKECDLTSEDIDELKRILDEKKG